MIIAAVLAGAIAALTVTWSATADELQQATNAAKVNQKPKRVELTILDRSGEELSVKGGVRIEVSHVGYPSKLKLNRRLLTDDQGKVILENFAAGTHSLIIGPGDSSPTIFSVSFPPGKAALEQRLQKRPGWYGKKVEMPQAEQHVRDYDPRPSISIKLTNHEKTPYHVTASDFNLTNMSWRVFLPKSQRFTGQVIKPGQSRYFSIDWLTILREGLWVSRASEAIDEPWPLAPAKKDYQYFRVNVGKAGFKPIQLKSPQVVLGEWAAWRKATVSVSHGKKMYFIGEKIVFRYSVTNHARQPIKVGWGGDSRAPRQLRFKVIATGPEEPVEDPHPNPFCMGGVGGTVEIAPGERDERWKFVLGRYCNFTKPGKYRVRVYHDLGWESPGRTPDLMRNEIPKSSLVPVAETIVELRAPTVRDAGFVLGQARKNFASGYDALAAFTGLNDNAYLSSLRKWVDENGGTLDRDDARQTERVFGLPAIVGIGGIATPEATGMLVDLMKHADVRVASAAFDQLLLRLPYPHLRERRSWSGGWANMHRMAKASWREKFRRPVFDHAFALLTRGYRAGSKPEDRTTEVTRKNRIQAAKALQAVAKRAEYPKLFAQVETIADAYKNVAQEQHAYPRPESLTARFADALWYSFCDGKTKYEVGESRHAVAANKAKLELLFGKGEIDVFTTGRLLKQVKSFRPMGWQAWVERQLSSDVPWIRAHTLTNLPLPLNRQLLDDVSANIKNEHGVSAAVQAAALLVADRSPHAEFVPAIRVALGKTNDKWLRPLAESALKKCRAVTR